MVPFVDRVDAQPVDVDFYVAQPAQAVLLGRPVEVLEPGRDEGVEDLGVHAVVPAARIDLVGPTGATQAVAQVIDDFLIDGGVECLDAHGRVLSRVAVAVHPGRHAAA
jgi:hypothetical protein